MPHDPSRPLAALALAATGCAAVPPPADGTVVAGGECRGEALAGFAGRQKSDALRAEILRASGARVLQWIGPDEMVTMEFRADRVRVQLDANGRVVTARCG